MYYSCKWGKIFFLYVYTSILAEVYIMALTDLYTWIVGVIILFVLIATAFLRYVLP